MTTSSTPLFTIDADGTVRSDFHALARHYGRQGLQQMVNDMAAAGASQRSAMTFARLVSAVAR